MEGLINKMKNIHRDPSLSPLGLAPGTAKKTSSKSHIPGALLPGHDGRMQSDPHSRRGGAVSPSLLLNKRFTFPFLALLAALTLGLLFLLPGGLLQAQSAEQFFTYAENGTGPVATFTASDPEGATPGFWSLVPNDATFDTIEGVEEADAADEDLFEIDQSGVLSFKSPRSYEDDSNSGDKEYRVTVQVSDGSEVEYFKAYVTVTDVEETGKVTWIVGPDGSATTGTDIKLQQFQPGAQLLASVSDPDGGATANANAWKWYRGSTRITTADANDNTYTVVAADVGERIRVEATFTDTNGGAAETRSFTSQNPVQEYRRPGDNDAPVFASAAISRRVEENSTGNVGGPVTATDGNGDKLTYTLGTGDDETSFKIDMGTGQLMVGDDVKLDYETKTSYEVTVAATDSSGTATATSATVTINVINVDEKPTFATDSNTGGVLNAGGVIAAQTEGRTLIDTDDDPANADTTEAAILVASDPDGKKVTLSLMGSDADSFELAEDTDTGNGVSQVLSFKEKTDYEMPGDRNRDNVYEVTVRASDGTLYADRALIIKVINDATEGGKVTVSPAAAVVGVELTATLAHMEGGVAASGQTANEMWQWQKSEVLGANQVCDENTSYATNIDDATKATYTPVSDDEGSCLRAMVTYNYQFAAEETMASSAGTEVLVSQANQAPKFKEGTRTFRVVAENVMANDADDAADQTDGAADNVGSPIEATDANGDDPTYSLSGASASLFRVRSNGQIEVKGKLDHETNASHTVTLTANDGSGTSNDRATITVTIYVTDMDEAPTIKDRADSTAEGMRTVDYRENSTGPVARFTASDPEGATPSFWMLTPEAVSAAEVETADIADRALFEIDQSGVLSFMKPRSYEDDSNSGDKEYRVTVQVSDGNNNGYFELTVAVTDVEETGKVTWIVGPDGSATTGTDIKLQQFQPGAQLLASVSDPDGGATANANAWKWYRGSTRITTANDNTYTVVAADVGERIRVEATFTDTNGGAAETRSFTSENPVQAVRPSGDNDAPVFAPTAVSRRVEENSTGNVGGPVTATDGNGDKLTYTLGTGDDETSFKIDMGTGQLMVGDDVKLDYETKTSYEVTVAATDSSGTATATSATVTINVINVDEKPTFATDSNTGGVLNAGGVIAAQTEGRTLIDTDDDPANADTTEAAILVASDPDGKKVTLSLMGSDADSFELAEDTDTGNGVSQVLSFKEKTDYEMPGDRNRDNVYEVTVRASDGTLYADRALIIKVINDATEGGKVTVSPAAAVVGVELTATLAHMEGGVAASGQTANEMWQWQKSEVLGANQVCDENTSYATNIDDATKATYTPVSDDEGSCLRAMVTYNYQFAAEETMASSAGTEVLVSQANQAPKFKEGTRTFRVVAENVMANDADDAADQTDGAADNVGSPIEATDANGDDPTYSLSGASASLFRVRSNGQIEVKGKLDHETNASHTVTLTADDSSGTSNDRATITVTIYVTDVDEGPDIMVGGLAISGPASKSYAENGMDAVGTYTLAGPMKDRARLTLEGDDVGDFRISSGGMLTFMSSPNYEMPMDANTDNTYMVTLKASDGTYTDTHDVMVRVTNEDEPGRVTFWRDGADATNAAIMVGDELGGAVDDSDGNPGDTFPIAMYTRIANVTSWQWARSMDMTNWEAIGTGGMYTVMDDDAGYYLRATATYTDGEGVGKMASEETIMVGAMPAEMTLLERYDDGDDGWIQLDEARDAVGDYFVEPKGTVLSLEDARKVVGLYFEYKNSLQ